MNFWYFTNHIQNDLIEVCLSCLDDCVLVSVLSHFFPIDWGSVRSALVLGGTFSVHPTRSRKQRILRHHVQFRLTSQRGLVPDGQRRKILLFFLLPLDRSSRRSSLRCQPKRFCAWRHLRNIYTQMHCKQSAAHSRDAASKNGSVSNSIGRSNN